MLYDIMPFMDAIVIDSIVFYNSSSMTSEVYKHWQLAVCQMAIITT